MRIDSSGNVGIGTSSPDGKMHLFSASAGTVTAAAGADELVLENNSTVGMSFLCPNDAGANIIFGDPDDNNVGGIQYGHATNYMSFTTNASEAMRIDSSGNLLVGKTAGNTNTVGAEIQSVGIGAFTASNANPLLVNRNTTDGDLVLFRKDGTTVGAIGVNSSDLYITRSNNCGIKFDISGDDGISPCTSSGNTNDDAVNLGHYFNRFKDLYLSGGVYLGGTGAANYLDDYEEGTWTPTYVAETNFSSITHDVQQGEYTKIGNVVHINLTLRTDALSGGSGAVRIAGLPFTPVIIASATLSQADSFATNPTRAFFTSTDVSINLLKQTTFGSNPAALDASDMSTGTNDNLLRLSGFYILS